MKANRKFLKGDDEAVSPVIAVILMVAITVVLAATVYVWVSGFGGGGQASKSMSLSSNGAITAPRAGDQMKAYTITAATPGLKYSDIRVTLDGAPLNCDGAAADAADSWRVMSGGSAVACTTTDGSGPDRIVGAGDTIQIYDDASSTLSGKTLRVLDAQANSVILTLTIG